MTFLLVLVNRNYRFFVVWHGVTLKLGCIGSCRSYVGEYSLYFLLHFIDIYIAYDDYSLKVGTIPLAVVAAKVVIWEVHHYVHLADGQAFTILAAWIEFRQGFLVHSHHCRTASAPFFIDDASFLVYLSVFQQQIVTPVMKYEQTGVESTGYLYIHIIYIIYSLVETGIGIQVLSKLHTYTFQIFFYSVAREVGSSVETHVFKEMGKTTLVVILLDGTYFLSDIKICSFLRPVVVSQIVCQTIGQSAFANCRVEWQLLSRNADA